MFIHRIAEVLQIKGVIPVTQVWSMIVGPAMIIGPFRMGPVDPHGLPALRSDGITKSPFMNVGINGNSTDITDWFICAACLGIANSCYSQEEYQK
jgi:hypothetical protein